MSWLINPLRPRQNCCHFANGIFKCIFLHENVWILPRVSLEFAPWVSINNILVLVQIMAWCQSLFEPMMVSLLMHICITRLRWGNDSNLQEAWLCVDHYCGSSCCQTIWTVMLWVYQTLVVPCNNPGIGHNVFSIRPLSVWYWHIIACLVGWCTGQFSLTNWFVGWTDGFLTKLGSSRLCNWSSLQHLVHGLITCLDVDTLFGNLIWNSSGFRKFEIMENNFCHCFNHVLTYILMSHNLTIFYIHLAHFHDSNSAISFT